MDSAFLGDVPEGLFDGYEGRKRRLYYDRIKQYLEEADRQFSRLGMGHSSFCTKGCSNCCCHTFHTSKAEVDVVTWYLLEHEAVLATFLRNYAARERLLQPVADLHDRCNDSNCEGSVANLAFYALKIPCAFLHDSACLIYQIRPITCAAFVSLVPPKICAIAPRNSISGAMQRQYNEARRWLAAQAPRSADDATADISRRVYAALRRLGELPGESVQHMAPQWSMSLPLSP